MLPDRDNPDEQQPGRRRREDGAASARASRRQPTPWSTALYGSYWGRGRTGSWRPGYAQELPHADGSIDRVFSSLMLHHLHDDKDALLAEVRRVLRPDGLLVLADIDGHTAVDGHGFLRRRMAHNPMIHDNAGMVERIKAAGFAVEAPVEHRLRMGRITIVRAHPGDR